MKIMIAEDDVISRRVLENALTKWGFDVTAVADGQSAWDVFQKEDAPRMAIVDWMLPELDGIEVCRRIRAAETTSSTYIILLTSRSDKQDIIDGLSAGADDYIVKPFDQEELHARVEVGRRVSDLQTSLIEKEKLKGIVEIAGAVCHELNQPMQAVLGYTDLLLMDLSEDAPLYERIKAIKSQVDRMVIITKKMMATTRYKTKDYLNGKIVDLENASEQ
jgi:DNA-binding response OmpR family regulator